MTDGLVLDASASLAFVLGEPMGGAVREHLIRQRDDGRPIVVPEVYWLEVSNVLVGRHHWSMERVLAAFRDLDEFELATLASSRALVLLGLDLALAHGLSAYDAAYLALAQAEDARLLTVDRSLARAAGERSVITFPGAVHEELATYGTARPVGALAAHGQYLAQLRREAEAGILR